MTGLIGVAGGIGSGKSVVCRILSAMGYPVYDCDARARIIMDSDAKIKEQIACRIDPQSIMPDGSIDRRRLANIVFGDRCKLEMLNSIVHGAVRADLLKWTAATYSDLAFVETAILYESGVDRIVDAVWQVVAPQSVRIERVMRRNGMTAQEAVSRIEAQRFKPEERHSREHFIDNGGNTPLLRQINMLLQNR